MDKLTVDEMCNLIKKCEDSAIVYGFILGENTYFINYCSKSAVFYEKLTTKKARTNKKWPNVSHYGDIGKYIMSTFFIEESYVKNKINISSVIYEFFKFIKNKEN